jgi:hypothetical protein
MLAAFGEATVPLSRRGMRGVYRSPALAESTGAGRRWTVSMSSLLWLVPSDVARACGDVEQLTRPTP